MKRFLTGLWQFIRNLAGLFGPSRLPTPPPVPPAPAPAPRPSGLPRWLRRQGNSGLSAGQKCDRLAVFAGFQGMKGTEWYHPLYSLRQDIQGHAAGTAVLRETAERFILWRAWRRAQDRRTTT